VIIQYKSLDLEFFNFMSGYALKTTKTKRYPSGGARSKEKRVKVSRVEKITERLEGTSSYNLS